MQTIEEHGQRVLRALNDAPDGQPVKYDRLHRHIFASPKRHDEWAKHTINMPNTVLMPTDSAKERFNVFLTQAVSFLAHASAYAGQIGRSITSIRFEPTPKTRS